MLARLLQCAENYRRSKLSDPFSLSHFAQAVGMVISSIGERWSRGKGVGSFVVTFQEFRGQRTQTGTGLEVMHLDETPWGETPQEIP